MDLEIISLINKINGIRCENKNLKEEINQKNEQIAILKTKIEILKKIINNWRK